MKQPANTQVAENDSGLNINKQGGRYNILVIDDEISILLTVEKIFKKAGHHVIVMNNGEIALETLNMEKFDYIYLDINMPGLNGFQVFERIKSRTSHPRINFFTANYIDGKTRNYIKMADGIVNKPFTIKELLDSLI